MVTVQLFWEQAVPFPFTSLLEMRNYRDDFIHTESTPAFKESKDWKRSSGSARPATAVLHLMQGFELEGAGAAFWAYCCWRWSSERRGETISPSSSIPDFS